ncbi:MAG: cation:proton antiporter [Clostridiales bacterium]|nr:cation:proton antiporter [Clostridiales bacterium]
MNSYQFILDLLLILLSTKLLGLLSQRFYLPGVVGALLAGLLIGPAVLGLVHPSDFLSCTASIGVLFLMFTSGLETDLEELKRCGGASFVIALAGVLVPLAGGFGVGFLFNRPDILASDASCSLLLQNIFLGTLLTATSVSITVETLRELGKLKSKVGSAILGAAIIDDILGILGLTIVTSFSGAQASIPAVCGKILLFFVAALAAGWLSRKVFRQLIARPFFQTSLLVVLAVALCLFFAFGAEHWFGVADITGAYVAGLCLSNLEGEDARLTRQVDTVSMVYLSPVFFASIGLTVTRQSLEPALWLFVLALTAVAVLTKPVGCSLGARLCRYSRRQSLQIGVGMVSRGEVALIIASKGIALGMLSTQLFSAVVLVVVATTILTPILLKLTFSLPKRATRPLGSSCH